MATLKGTWRFNDTINSVQGDYLRQEINFTVSCEYEGTSFGLYCSKFKTIDHSIGGVELYYTVDSVEPTDDVIQPDDDFTVYRDEWIYAPYGVDLKTITITTDSEVSAEFYEWFTANAVEQKEISGVWKFYDVLTQSHASNDFGGCIFEGHFTATSCLNFPAMPEYGIEAYTGKHTFECTQIYQEYNDSVEGYIGSVSYRVITVQPDLPERLGITLLVEPYVYSSAGEGWDTVYGRGFQTLYFGTEPQYVSVNFYNWLTENATQPTASIQYNGSTIANLFGGQTATLKCEGMRMESDVVVEVAEVSGGGSCTKPHVIEVDELPTEGEENALYLCGGSYWKYMSGNYSVMICDEGQNIADLYPEEAAEMDFATVLASVVAPVQAYYYANTKPTEGIVESTQNGLAIYYIADENGLFGYAGGEWASMFDIGISWPLPFIGAISDPSESTEAGYYFINAAGWKKYIAEPSEKLTITENGSHNVTEYASVNVAVPNAAIVGVWRFNVYEAGPDQGYAENSGYYIFDVPMTEAYNCTQKVNFSCVHDGETKNMTTFEYYFDNNDGHHLLRFKDDENNTLNVVSSFQPRNEWDGSFSQIVDFGAEPQVVSATFKELMTQIAKPIYTITQTE